MYAIIRSGGRQVRVAPGSTVLVDHLDTEIGQEVTFEQVLFVRNTDGAMLAGSPLVTDVRVIGVIDGDARGPKIRVFKKKRRKGYRRTRGHRSILTRVQIKEIQTKGSR